MLAGLQRRVTERKGKVISVPIQLIVVYMEAKTAWEDDFTSFRMKELKGRKRRRDGMSEMNAAAAKEKDQGQRRK